MYHVEFLRAPGQLLDLERVQQDGIQTARLAQADGVNGHEFRRSSRVTGGEQRDVVSGAHELVDEISDDALGAAV
jgi:hypothetical protein